MSRDCCVALPDDTTGLSAVMIVVFHDLTHVLFWYRRKCLSPLVISKAVFFCQSFLLFVFHVNLSHCLDCSL